MNILVLGGTGFIGLRAIRLLAERGENVVCYDVNPGAASFDGLEDRVKVMRGDITQFEDVVSAILKVKPDRIINLAYLLGGGEVEPHLNMAINILGMDNCFEAARLCGVQRVVYASSVAVCGPQRNHGDQLVDEDAPTSGTRQYAVHKIFNEFQAAIYSENYGMKITGIRPANVTGPDKVRGSVDHVQCVVLPAQGEPVRFPKMGLMRAPVHVDDVAEAFVRVALSDFPHHSLYNTGGEPISLGALADIVREFIPDAQISFDAEGGIEDSGTYLVDNSRLRNEFELEYPPFRSRVLQIINEVRADAGMPLVKPKAG